MSGSVPRICDACGLRKDADQFAKTSMPRAHPDAQHLVCLACVAMGYSAYDVQGYPCVGCGKKGCLHLSRYSLRMYKNKKMHVTLVCKDCISRCNDIRQKLRRPKSWRCTCPGSRITRVHLAGNEKCMLYPKYAGEKRWPGKNVNVSLEDFQVYERCSKRRKVEK